MGEMGEMRKFIRHIRELNLESLEIENQNLIFGQMD